MRCSILIGAVTRRTQTTTTPLAATRFPTPTRVARFSPFPNVSTIDIRTPGVTEKHWASQSLPIVDRLLEPQTVVNFVPFIINGTLPNNKKTSLPLLPDEEEVKFLFRPFAEWAPAPYSTKTSAPFDEIMMRIGSHEDGDRLCLSSLGGLPPLSAARWTEKCPDRPENFDVAVEYLTATLAVFEYLGIPQVRENLRDTFNFISGHLQEAQSAINARRIEQGQDHNRTPINLTALWEEYMRAKFEVMTTMAHTFVVLNACDLQIPIVKAISSLPADNEAAMKPLLERWEQLTRVIQVADLKIWLPMDGYAGYQAPAETVAGLHNSDLPTLKQTYQEAFEHVGYKLLEAQINEQEKQGKDKQSYESRYKRLAMSTAAQDQLRTVIRGSAECHTPREPWIQEILRRRQDHLESDYGKAHEHGFELAVYRTAHYEGSDEHWDGIRRKFESHLSTWDGGVEGAEEVEPLLKVHWFDAKELGLNLGADSVNAAKKHFQQIRSSDTYKHRLNPTTFLILDGWSARSYHDPDFLASYTSQGLSPGDFQGHILAVDAEFDPAAPNERAEESPGYQGHMRISSNLVWSELYPMLIMQSATLEDLWPMAMEHPLKVYTGLTVPSQLDIWRENNSFKAGVLGPFVEHLKSKSPELGRVVEDYMMPRFGGG
ncbi:hypothetical protein BJX70DRAFT_408921 [Aspergillus crustosus]